MEKWMPKRPPCCHDDWEANNHHISGLHQGLIKRLHQAEQNFLEYSMNTCGKSAYPGPGLSGIDRNHWFQVCFWIGVSDGP